MFHASPASLMSLLFPFSFLFNQELSLLLFYATLGLMESPGTCLGPTFLKRSTVIMCNVNDYGHTTVSAASDGPLRVGVRTIVVGFSQDNMI